MQLNTRTTTIFLILYKQIWLQLLYVYYYLFNKIFIFCFTLICIIFFVS